MAKKILATVLTILTLISMLILPSSAAVGGINSMTFNGLSEDRFSVSWWRSNLNKKYYAFLPADADLSSLTVTFKASDHVYVGSKKLISGEQTDVFSKEGEYSLKCGRYKCPLGLLRAFFAKS